VSKEVLLMTVNAITIFVFTLPTSAKVAKSLLIFIEISVVYNSQHLILIQKFSLPPQLFLHFLILIFAIENPNFIPTFSFLLNIIFPPLQ